jgi:hypothetical protein
MMPTTTNRPLTDERWLDFWRHYKGLPHQKAAVLKLARHIRQMDHGLLHDSAEWVEDFRTQPDSWATIRELAAKAGAKHPDLVAAQWALESGWGTVMSGRNNPFGLKGEGTVKPTTEVINGAEVPVDAEFKDFASIKAAVEHLVSRWYKDFTAPGGKEYQGVNRAASRDEAARLLVKEGYATDPDYAKKLIKLMDDNAPAQPAPAAAGGLDPRGSEEDGLAGPRMKAPVKPGDSYLLVNDRDQDMEAYDHTGKLLWKIPCLARGQGPDNDWRKRNMDTPPGLYKIGKVYADYEQNPKPPQSDTAEMYGWYSFDMDDLEGQESSNGRSGIMLHGGGTACGWPGAWAPRQALHSTLGCVRIHNIDLRDKVLPLVRKGTVYIGVFQER